MILHRLCCVLTFFAVTTSTAQAAQRELTVFRDGLLIEIETTAKKGIAEAVLPALIRDGTLRAKPLDDGSIQQVTVTPFKTPDKIQKELDGLIEQKNRLEDRLKALDTKEGIFEAAAKSQSSKAPRKTKTNPDPLASVRQGTDFAIAQLEAVFTARRRSEQEVKRINSRIAQLTKSAIGGPTVRIAAFPANSRIRVAAVLVASGWRPRYELRLAESGTARLVQLAELDELPAGFSIRIAPADLASTTPPQTVALLPGRATPLAAWQLPVTQEQVVAGPLPSYSISLHNNTGTTLPSGEAAVYSRQGEFLGTVTLPATGPGTTLTISNRHH